MPDDMNWWLQRFDITLVKHSPKDGLVGDMWYSLQVLRDVAGLVGSVCRCFVLLYDLSCRLGGGMSSVNGLSRRIDTHGVTCSRDRGMW